MQTKATDDEKLALINKVSHCATSAKLNYARYALASGTAGAVSDEETPFDVSNSLISDLIFQVPG